MSIVFSLNKFVFRWLNNIFKCFSAASKKLVHSNSQEEAALVLQKRECLHKYIFIYSVKFVLQTCLT